jgi:hypothetical protein
MGLHHRIFRLEKRTEGAARPCRSCGAGDADPARLVRVEFSGEYQWQQPEGPIPADYCRECGRQLVMRLEFDDAG